MDSHINRGILIMKSFAKIEAMAKKNALKNAPKVKGKNSKEERAKAFKEKCAEASKELAGKELN